jgi:DNA-binding IclR family transcriptional regulator
MATPKRKSRGTVNDEEVKGPNYSAPALEKGLDILELLSRTDAPLTLAQIARRLERSVGELYRMLACLVNRRYVVQFGDAYYITTKLFELANLNPPTHRLLIAAEPIMQKLAGDLDQACHLTVYDHGRQVVIAKVDVPTGMGFSVRVGSELDVIPSASGRVLLAFQDDERRQIRIEESLQRRPDHADPQLEAVLERIRKRGYESSPSKQVRGLRAVSFPVADLAGNAIAALTVPFTERIDQLDHKTVPETIETLAGAARRLCEQIGSLSPSTD